MSTTSTDKVMHTLVPCPGSVPLADVERALLEKPREKVRRLTEQLAKAELELAEHVELLEAIKRNSTSPNTEARDCT